MRQEENATSQWNVQTFDFIAPKKFIQKFFVRLEIWFSAIHKKLPSNHIFVLQSTTQQCMGTHDVFETPFISILAQILLSNAFTYFKRSSSFPSISIFCSILTHFKNSFHMTMTIRLNNLYFRKVHCNVMSNFFHANTVNTYNELLPRFFDADFLHSILILSFRFSFNRHSLLFERKKCDYAHVCSGTSNQSSSHSNTNTNSNSNLMFIC